LGWGYGRLANGFFCALTTNYGNTKPANQERRIRAEGQNLSKGLRVFGTVLRITTTKNRSDLPVSNSSLCWLRLALLAPTRSAGSDLLCWVRLLCWGRLALASRSQQLRHIVLSGVYDHGLIARSTPK
jgi:hypothetical protein